MKDGITVTLDEKGASIVCEALDYFKDSLDMESSHGKYRSAFLWELRETLKLAIQEGKAPLDTTSKSHI